MTSTSAQFRYIYFHSIPCWGRISSLFGGKCCLAAFFILTPPAQEQSFGDWILTAKLCGSFLANLDSASQVELERPLKSTPGLSRHILLRLGSEPAGVDSIQWYGQWGSLQSIIRHSRVQLPGVGDLSIRFHAHTIPFFTTPTGGFLLENTLFT